MNVEAYIFFLTQELKQQYKLSLKELLILAYFYYKNEHSISLKELSKKGYLNKCRDPHDSRNVIIVVSVKQHNYIKNLLSEININET
ncbi:transcriptional regulator, SarA/Rot family [Staphylococcus aureus]|uniref:transcriptional regulator, SarA/Rot family n=1 Tax=Staphylococcus aureus TaxID=1280 RepID=UPI003D9C7591